MYWLIAICFLALIEAKHVNIAAVGDSITHGECWGDGVGVQDEDHIIPGQPRITPYPRILKDMIGDDKTYTVKNLGVSGHTMLKNNELSYWSTGTYQEFLAFKPDIVIL